MLAVPTNHIRLSKEHKDYILNGVADENDFLEPAFSNTRYPFLQSEIRRIHRNRIGNGVGGILLYLV